MGANRRFTLPMGASLMIIFRKHVRIIWTVLLFVICTFAASAISKAGNNPSQPPANEESPAPQETALGLTAREAYAKWTAASGTPLILDVRTPEEFLFVGHAPMAWNIPVATQSYV